MGFNKITVALLSGFCATAAIPAASAQNQYTDSLGYTHIYSPLGVGNHRGNGSLRSVVPASVKAAYRRGDMDKVTRLLIRSARHDNTASMRYLALGYARGEILQYDPAKAAFWFRKAAEKGDSVSMYALSKLYSEGAGVEADREQAASWMKRSAQSGFDPAVWTWHDAK